MKTKEFISLKELQELDELLDRVYVSEVPKCIKCGDELGLDDIGYVCKYCAVKMKYRITYTIGPVGHSKDVVTWLEAESIEEAAESIGVDWEQSESPGCIILESPESSDTWEELYCIEIEDCDLY